MLKRLMAMAAAVGAALAAGRAEGATYAWTGLAGSNNWTASNGVFTNWSPNSVPPTTADVAFIQLAPFSSVNLQGGRTVNSVTFGGLENYTLTGGSLVVSSGKITANAATSATSHTIDGQVTLGAAGEFTVAGPAGLTLTQPVTDGSTTFGLTKDGTGTLSFRGTGTSSLYSLEVDDGLLDVNGASITVRQADPNVYSAVLGGSTTIHGGGKMTLLTNTNLVVRGPTIAATPVLTVDGVGSQITGANLLTIGEGGAPGGLVVSNHATVNTSFCTIGGTNTGGTTATGSITTQGVVVSGTGVIGALPNSFGAVTVDGSGSSWQTSDLHMGGFSDSQRGGTGTLTVTNAGNVTATGDTVFYTSGSVMTINGGTLTTSQLETKFDATPQIQLKDPAGGHALTLNNTNLGFTPTFAGVISDVSGGSGSLVKTGGGSQVLSGHNTYTGGTQVKGGTLVLGVGDALSPTGPVEITFGSTLDLGGSAQHTGDLTLTNGTLSCASGSSLVTANVNVSSGTISVPIYAGVVTKSTTGTATATKAINAALIVSGGTFDAQAGVANGVSVSAGANLKLRGTVGGAFLADAGGVITLTGGTDATGTANVSGTLDVNTQSIFFTDVTSPHVTTTAIAGGVITAPAGYVDGGTIQGNGTVAATVSGGSGAGVIASGGPLTVGTMAATDSLGGFAGTLAAGPNALTLLSSGVTTLGSAVTVAGGTINSINGVRVASGKTLSGYGVVNGAVNNLGTITGGSAGNVLKMTGAVSGAGGFAGAVEFDGSYSPGDGPAAVALTGNVTLGPLAQLVVELGGTTKGTQYDHLDVGGALALNGSIVVQAVNGYRPLPGAQFDLITYGSAGGDAAVVNGTGYPTIRFDKTYTATDLILTAAAMVSGDVNLDGRLDADDYALIDRGYAEHLTGYLNGDLNNSGAIDSADYLIIDHAHARQAGALSADFLAAREAEFGRDYVTALLASVPEPGVMGVGFIALIAGSRRRTRAN